MNAAVITRDKTNNNVHIFMQSSFQLDQKKNEQMNISLEKTEVNVKEKNE